LNDVNRFDSVQRSQPLDFETLTAAAAAATNTGSIPSLSLLFGPAIQQNYISLFRKQDYEESFTRLTVLQ
jgi:hypothetical protein